MLRQSPFHARVAAANETSLWSHWSDHLVADSYQSWEKSSTSRPQRGRLFDSSPLYKYRIVGRTPRRSSPACSPATSARVAPGQRPVHVLVRRRAASSSKTASSSATPRDDFLLTSAEPNLSYFARPDRARDRVAIEEVSDELGTLALQGPRSRDLLAKLVPKVGRLAFFGLTSAEIGGAAVTTRRTGFTGDLGYELLVDAGDALRVWDTLGEAGRPHGVQPFGQTPC